MIVGVDARWYNPSAAGWVVGVTTWTSSNHADNSTDCISANISWVSSISFNYAVSSEANWDFFEFYIDGIRYIHIAWLWINNFFSQSITGWSHAIRFCYIKDNSVSNGTDNVIVTNISSPISSIPVSDYFPVSWSTTNCPEDSQVDSIIPTNLDHTVLLGTPYWQYPYQNYSANDAWVWYALRPRQARVISGNSSVIQCQYWDSTLPTVTTVTYVPTATNGWTNNPNFPVTISATDYGGSNLSLYYLRYIYQDNPGSTTPWTWSSTWIDYWFVNANFNFNDPSRWSTSRAYRLLAYTMDWAGNWSSASLWWTIYVDTTPPDSNLFINTNALSFLATPSQVFTFTYNDGWAPVAIRSVFENFANPAATLSVFAPSGFAYTHTSPQNIQNVDLERGANWARPYTYRVSQICDQAGNCWNGTKDYSYDVYANPNTIVTNTQDTSALTSAVADGMARNFVQNIRDQYDNAIVPASGISRIVNLWLTSISNTMYLDQHNRSGWSAVFVDVNNIPLSIWSQALGNRTSTTGSYPLSLFVYTPTANSYGSTDPVSDPLAGFGFTTNLTVSDTLIGPAKVFSQTLASPIYRPLYVSNIVGNLRTGGFIEGTEQSNTITIIQAPTALAVPSYFDLNLEFSGSNSPNFDLVWGTSTYAAITNTLSPLAGLNTPTSVWFFSKLIQKPNITINTLSNIQLSTHIAYVLDGKTILYNSDIIGKTGWYWGIAQSLGNQVGIKIIGPIASNTIRAIVDGQFADGTSIFGWLSRADVRNKMKQSIALATRNMTLAPVGSLVDSLTIPNNSTSDAKGAKVEQSTTSSIYKIEKTGWNVTLSLAAGISGKRTLVVKGANLYINRDMYYTNSDSILWVVVQKDESGNGWNLYIDPNITNIVGTYIIDGSVLSYDGTTEIGVGNITTLKNQLYIYGSIVSENTIGWSRMSPIKCPSLLNVSCTTSAIAQSYDLNYLRRYYIFGGSPFGNAKIIGWGTCSSSICSGFQANLIQKFTTPNDSLAQYPVIIEYNPLIRTSPPVGFELSRE